MLRTINRVILFGSAFLVGYHATRSLPLLHPLDEVLDFLRALPPHEPELHEPLVNDNTWIREGF